MFSSVDKQAVKVCPVKVIAFVNLSAHRLNEGLGGKKSGSENIFTIKNPKKSRESHFSSAYYCKKVNYKGNHCRLYILIFHRPFYLSDSN